VLGAAAGVFESMSLFAASLEGSVLRLPSPHPFVLVLIAFAMALTGVQIRFGRKRKLAMAAVLLLTALLYLPRFDPSARYVQLDVGQGDASLIRTGRRAVVVDVGPAYSYDLLRYLRHEGLAVDAVILSHLDEDHAGALGVLLSSEIKVDRVIIDDRAQEYAASAMVTEAMDALMQAEKVETVGVGEQLDFGNVCLSVLSPGDALSGSNERSLLLACEAAGKTLLLAGDLPIGSEPERVPDCDVLKVAHHGSKNATSSGFLEMAQPEIALISAGAGNSYGHPHARVLKDLEQAGARILRTDRSGCITLGLQGETIAVQTMLGDTSGQAGKEAAVRE